MKQATREPVAVIAGVTGTLGHAIALELLAQGWAVRGVSRGNRNGSVRESLRISGANLIYGDLAEGEFVTSVCDGADTLVFAAGASGVAASFADPDTNLVDSAVPWLNLLLAASRGTRVILLSSQTVYGPSSGKPFTTASPLRPASPYALHRVLMEEHGKMFSHRNGTDVVVLRLVNVFGDVHEAHRPRTHGVVERMLQDLLHEGVAQLYGGGTQSVELLHASDLARAVAALVSKRPATGRFSVYNIGGEELTVLQIAEALCRGLGKGTALPIPWDPGMEMAMAKDVQLDDGSFRRAYGWRPTADVVNMIEGLASAWRD